MEHHVRFAPDDLMPTGRNWVLCRGEDVTTLYIRESTRYRMSAESFALLLESAWEAYRGLVERDWTTVVPIQREQLHAFPFC